MRRPHRLCRRHGFSLVELMIAIALGAVLMLAVTELATRNSAVRNELQRSAAQIENGVFAIQQLEQDIANAGFWGETGQPPAVTYDGAQYSACSTTPPLFVGTATAPAALGEELRQATCYPVLGGQAPPTPAGLAVKDGTDYLAIRRGSSCSLDDAGCDPAVPGDVYLQANACFEPNVSGAPAPGDLQFSTVVAELEFMTRACDTVTPVELAPRYRLLSRIYFINDDDQLARAELSGTGPGAYDTVEALVDGVEALRLEYGLDNGATTGSFAGDGQVDEYVRTPLGAGWSDVVAVRVFLVVRSRESSPGHVDNRSYTVAGESYTVPAAYSDYKRQVFSRTVVLRNVAERRE
ncbi:PilW family protein [Pseudohaliea rubra]|uniref:Type IV fimbrial biogenesis protein PilW n=1 Tax=Pseudohaliea rubra DSM 19751 TaxID=1265313 RepID=A0A095VSV6_9GAMM|nr:PilW family protein [Pseudohaliea rubra]KGE04138.1 Type IV fimbrial biogenesis protein PilW [Pseudohaliea rubra DSM 19751]